MATTYQPTIFSDCEFIVEDGKKTGVVWDRGNEILEHRLVIGDIVTVEGDSFGDICPTIHHSGIGTITDIRDDNTDYWFFVEMQNGESGCCKSSRLRLRKRKPSKRKIG